MTQIERLGIVMPVYNEAATLRGALERLFKTQLPVDLEVVVVDDGSVDGGIDSIADLVASNRVKLVRHDVNRGKGAALITGFQALTTEYATILDADFEYDPADYAQMLRPVLEDDAKVVYGTRSFGAHTAFSFWYVLGNRFLSFWASFLFNTWLSDVETCYKLAPVSIWRSLEIKSRGFGVEAEVTAKFLKRGHRIFEVPISYKARGREEGKKLNWTDGLEALWILLRIRLFGRRITHR